MVLANLFRSFPKAIYIVRKFFFKPNFSYKIWPGMPANPFLKNLKIKDLTFYQNSVVKRTSKVFRSPNGIRKYNSLLQAYGYFNSIIRYRYQLPPQTSLLFTGIRASYETKFQRCLKFPKKMHMSFLKPKKFLANGCFGAVWAAKCSHLEGSTQDDGQAPSQYVSNDLAVKVLYNFYASKPVAGDPESDFESSLSAPKQWYLFNKQVERECNFRPASDHPNIVPILNKFLDFAPPAGDQSNTLKSTIGDVVLWENAENFPEGFGGRPITCYLIMPRFDATLEDLACGKWKPNFSSHSSTKPSTDCLVLAPSQTEPCISTNPKFTLPTEDAVALLAQLFEAVAELELCEISHRDLKPSNILVRIRESNKVPKMAFLNPGEAELANSRLHATITDFGCATRTGGQFSENWTETSAPSHSGNTALWPPEVALYFRNQQEGGSLSAIPLNYSRADVWSAATHTYLLFGGENPFLTGRLSSVDYSDQYLPALPSSAPSILNWVVQACLCRDPKRRPPASLVADILHVWCIEKHFARRVSTTLNQEIDSFSKRIDIESWKYPFKGVSFSSEDSVKHCSRSLSSSEHAPIQVDLKEESKHLRHRVHRILQLLWAYDWLFGPAKPPSGLRWKFYGRITPDRFIACLRRLNRSLLANISLEV